MRVVVIGATGATGRVAVEELRARGHAVTAFARRPEALGPLADEVEVARGDVMRASDVAAAVRGKDAVVVTLGIRENALRVRLAGSAATAMNVRSAGTANVIAAMRHEGLRRLVVQTTYGVGETHRQLSLTWKLLFSLLLKPQIADTEEQERVVRESGLDWVLVRPVALTDDEDEVAALASTDGEVRSMKVPRRAVARLLADAVEGTSYLQQAVALSA